MKSRVENGGLHTFDRENGLHILFNEFDFPANMTSKSPRTLSIALTNMCNLNCHYCYAPKNNRILPTQFIKDIAKRTDSLGSLEITFGGGEPFMHPEIIHIVNWIWDNTKLGINITTNGHLINSDVINKIKGKLSSLRFSVDGLEPKYSSIKKKNLSDLVKKIYLIKGIIPFGLNIIINPNSTEDVIKVINLALELGAMDVLLIPEHKDGNFLLTDEDWEKVRLIIKDYSAKIQINVTYDASFQIESDYLDTDTENDFLFAHISADKKLKLHSYENEGILIENPSNIKNHFVEINQN